MRTIIWLIILLKIILPVLRNRGMMRQFSMIKTVAELKEAAAKTFRLPADWNVWEEYVENRFKVYSINFNKKFSIKLRFLWQPGAISMAIGGAVAKKEPKNMCAFMQLRP